MKYRISSGVVVLALAGAGLAALLHNSNVQSDDTKKKGTGTVREPGSGNNSTRPPSTTAPTASGSLAHRSAASVGPVAKGGSDVGAAGAGFQAPDYNDAGELKRPTGYETWVFVGSNLGIEYGDAAAKEKPAEKEKTETKRPGKGANFHNVYINPEAYAHYLKTGKFPEKTVLVLDIFKAEEREPRKIVAEGLFPGAHSGLAVAVKNSARPDGAKTDWAYYDFGLEGKTAKAFADKACYDCHLEHADDDNVWVQFYPTLRGKNEGR
jgi:hypothetical protein